jgi:hypothetical protein
MPASASAIATGSARPRGRLLHCLRRRRLRSTTTQSPTCGLPCRRPARCHASIPSPVSPHAASVPMLPLLPPRRRPLPPRLPAAAPGLPEPAPLSPRCRASSTAASLVARETPNRRIPRCRPRRSASLHQPLSAIRRVPPTTVAPSSQTCSCLTWTSTSKTYRRIRKPRLPTRGFILTCPA